MQSQPFIGEVFDLMPSPNHKPAMLFAFYPAQVYGFVQV